MYNVLIRNRDITPGLSAGGNHWTESREGPAATILISYLVGLKGCQVGIEGEVVN